MPDVTEQTGELSAVARRRLNELLSQRALDAPSPSEGEDAEFAAEPSTDWITSLREAGASVGAPSPVTRADEAPTRGGGLPQWFGTAVTFTREHLVTVVVVLVVGILWTGYSLFQVRTTPVADAVPRVENTAASPSAPASGQPSAAVASSEVVVHVIGAVRHAGVYQLAEGSRVADAIAAAGGLRGSADTGELNLAQVLSDGIQLKIGTRKHPGGWLRAGANAASSTGAGAGTDGASAKLSINSATEAQLDTLPGIGPVTAAKIVAWRAEHGKFTALTELQEVDGIGPKTYADLAERIQL